MNFDMDEATLKLERKQFKDITIKEWEFLLPNFPYYIAELMKSLISNSLKCFECETEVTGHESKIIKDGKLRLVCEDCYWEIYYGSAFGI